MEMHSFVLFMHRCSELAIIISYKKRHVNNNIRKKEIILRKPKNNHNKNREKSKLFTIFIRIVKLTANSY